jgi:hypothetical protein
LTSARLGDGQAPWRRRGSSDAANHGHASCAPRLLRRRRQHPSLTAGVYRMRDADETISLPHRPAKPYPWDTETRAVDSVPRQYAASSPDDNQGAPCPCHSARNRRPSNLRRTGPAGGSPPKQEDQWVVPASIAALDCTCHWRLVEAPRSVGSRPRSLPRICHTRRLCERDVANLVGAQASSRTPRGFAKWQAHPVAQPRGK